MAIRLRCIFASLMLVALSASVQAQVVEDTLRIYFHKSSAIYNRPYRDNEARAQEFFTKFNALTSVTGVATLKVETIGVASPEGDPAFNEIISKARMAALRRIIRSKSNFPDSLIAYTSLRADWGELAKFVDADDNVPNKQRALEIIRNYEGDKIAKLLTVGWGKTYWYIYHNIYPKVRAARITYQIDLSSLIAEPEPVPEDTFDDVDEDLFEDLQVDTTLGLVIVHPVAKTVFKFGLKTNVVGWGFGMINLAAEVDAIPHLSVHIPFYYSGGYDYFTPTIKFRGIVFQPEVRYYPWLKNQCNEGFFAGAHLGLGWYNYALNGDYRIQDYGGRRPAFGGGLSVGYKTRFKKNPSWGVEFALGAGVYNAKYDIFYNVENGPYYKSGIRKTWFGIDNAAVSFFYDIDIKKKGGKR